MANTPRLLPVNLYMPGQGPQVIEAIIPVGVPFSAVLVPSFWAFVAPKLAARAKPLSRIHVTAEDGTYSGLLLIRDIGSNWVRVSKLSYVDCDAGIEPDIVSEDDGLVIKHRGFGNFGVWDGRRKDWLGESHRSKEAADGYLRSHRVAMKSGRAAA